MLLQPRAKRKGENTMLEEIITQVQFIETCPPPECNLSSKDIEQFVEEMDDYLARIQLRMAEGGPLL